MRLPYASARSGMSARSDIVKILKRFGADSVGFMDKFETHTVLLAFTLHGQNIQLPASAQGWANAFLKEKPWNSRMRRGEEEYKIDTLNQGMIAVNSILRDWVKGQITAIETGILTFEHVFMPFMLASDGRFLHEHAMALLPTPKP